MIRSKRKEGGREERRERKEEEKKGREVKQHEREKNIGIKAKETKMSVLVWPRPAEQGEDWTRCIEFYSTEAGARLPSVT